MPLYFDHNSTSELHPAAREAMINAMEAGGNPSSIHGFGRKAAHIMENARDLVGKTLNVDPKGIIFTSCCTEANMAVLTPHWRGCGFDVPIGDLFLCATEHPCVLAGGSFMPQQIHVVPVDENGIVNSEILRQMLAKSELPPMVSIMLANNETGVIQPISELADLIHEYNGFFHVDACQAFGRIPIDMKTLKTDVLTFSAHKAGGPLGVGVIAKRSHQFEMSHPLLRGGGQEKGQRAGTQNVAAIAGLGAVCDFWHENSEGLVSSAMPQNDIIQSFLVSTFPSAIIFGTNAERLPNTILFAIPNVTAEKALMAFDIAGVALSSGSACSSGKVGKSHVLKAMGISDELAACAIRISMGWNTSQNDVQEFIAIAGKVLARLSEKNLAMVG